MEHLSKNMGQEKYYRMEHPNEIMVKDGKQRNPWRLIAIFGLLFSVFIALLVFCVFRYAVNVHCEENNHLESDSAQRKRKTVDFLWFSDLHLDLYYKESASLDWATSYCRNASVPAKYTAKYGRMGCDSPAILLRNTLYAMKGVHTGKKNPKFIVFTGDSSAHNMDEGFTDHTTRRERVLTSMRTSVEEVNAAFPVIPYFPSIGNNDIPGHYVLPRPNDTWYSDLLDFWQDSILGTNCKLKHPTTTKRALRRTFLKGGYYKVNLPDTRMVLLVLNSMYWAKKTWVAESYFVDLANEQMNWFKRQLQFAKITGKKVLVNSHVPPGTDTFSSDWTYPAMWLKNYTQSYLDLVTIYSDIIAGQMYAHYHVDDYRLLQSPTDKFASRLSFILLAASVSPCYDNNPNFRVVQLDPKHQTMLDYEQYYVDLVMATQYDSPVWQLDYRFSSKYPPKGKKDKVINGHRINNLCDQLINKTSNKIYDGFVTSRKINYHQNVEFSRFVLYCSMKYIRADDFNDCFKKFKVPGG